MTQIFQGSESWMHSSPLQGEISPEEQLAWAQVKNWPVYYSLPWTVLAHVNYLNVSNKKKKISKQDRCSFLFFFLTLCSNQLS